MAKISKEMKQVKGMVTTLLTNEPKYRDSDRMLCAKIWSIQMGGMDNLKKMSSYAFLTEYVAPKSKLYSPISIVRVRRRLQADNPDLRGTKYRTKKRKDEETDVKEELEYPVKRD